MLCPSYFGRAAVAESAAQPRAAVPADVPHYRRRASHVQDSGLPTLGFREAVRRLQETPHTSLRLAGVKGATGYPACVVFLAPDEAAVVAALAVLIRAFVRRQGLEPRTR